MANKSLKKFKRELLANKAVRAAYDEQAPEFAIAQAIIKARHERGLTQEQLAEATGTTAQFSLKKA